MIARLRARLRDDRGFTLSEMIIVGLITTIILLAIGGMYISTVRAQQTISVLTETTNSAQLSARSIDAGVRNGVALRPIETGADGGQLLVVCTVGASDAITHRWQAWYYSPENGGELRARTADPGTPPAVPDADELAGWTLLLSGVQPLDGATTIFAIDGDDESLVSVRFFTSGDDTNSATIDFTTHLAPRPSTASESECS